MHEWWLGSCQKKRLNAKPPHVFGGEMQFQLGQFPGALWAREVHQLRFYMAPNQVLNIKTIAKHVLLTLGFPALLSHFLELRARHINTSTHAMICLNAHKQQGHLARKLWDEKTSFFRDW